MNIVIGYIMCYTRAVISTKFVSQNKTYIIKTSLIWIAEIATVAKNSCTPGTEKNQVSMMRKISVLSPNPTYISPDLSI